MSRDSNSIVQNIIESRGLKLSVDDFEIHTMRSLALKLCEKYGVELNYAGSGYKALVFSDLILQGQIKSLILSFLIVILLLTMMFKNIKIVPLFMMKTMH